MLFHNCISPAFHCGGNARGTYAEQKHILNHSVQIRCHNGTVEHSVINAPTILTRPVVGTMGTHASLLHSH